ncbi:MAG TPA: DivIVA domain-containing protein [Nitrospirota bacterium]
MNVTPLDIKQKQFKLGFRGFNIEEVDSFLEEITETLEELVRERETLKEEKAKLEAQVEMYQQTERGLRDTLVAAQQMTGDMKAAAEKEAKLKVQEAEMDAEKILRSARAELARTQEEIAELKRIRERFKLKIKGVIEDHLKMLSYEDRQIGEEVD